MRGNQRGVTWKEFYRSLVKNIRSRGIDYVKGDTQEFFGIF